MQAPRLSGSRPPAPTPQLRPLGPWALLKALRTNPLECWTKGAALALQKATLVVATLMKHFDLDLVPGQSVWPVIDFTMKPRDGLRMTAKHRRSSTNLLAAE